MFHVDAIYNLLPAVHEMWKFEEDSFDTLGLICRDFPHRPSQYFINKDGKVKAVHHGPHTESFFVAHDGDSVFIGNDRRGPCMRYNTKSIVARYGLIYSAFFSVYTQSGNYETSFINTGDRTFTKLYAQCEDGEVWFITPSIEDCKARERLYPCDKPIEFGYHLFEGHIYLNMDKKIPNPAYPVSTYKCNIQALHL